LKKNFISYLNCSRFFATHTKLNWLTSKNLHLLVTIRKLCSEAKPHFNWYRVPGTQKMLLRQQERLLEQHTTIGMMSDVWLDPHDGYQILYFNACSQDEAHPYQKVTTTYRNQAIYCFQSCLHGFVQTGASLFRLGNHNSGRCLCECATANSWNEKMPFI
jgi:hypothetical protein